MYVELVIKVKNIPAASYADAKSLAYERVDKLLLNACKIEDYNTWAARTLAYKNTDGTFTIALP